MRFLMTTSFISQLSLTCQSNAPIREDGGEITLFDRIADFFYGKNSNDHFLTVCQKLSETPITELSSLSREQQIEILGRIRQIQRKMKNETLKLECNEHIQNFESIVLKERSTEFSGLIFNQMLVPSLDKKRAANCLRKFDAIIDYYSTDQEALGKIIANWHSFYQNNNNQKSKSLIINSVIVTKLLNKEEKMLLSGVASPVHYRSYPKLLRIHLENEWRKGNKTEVYARILTLESLMDQNPDNTIFIQTCLQQINQLLVSTLYSSSEYQKKDLMVLKNLFPVVNQYLPFIEDKKLKLDLKLKFANLPTSETRSAYPNLFLSQKDQLDILIDSLQGKENKTTEQLVEFLKVSKLCFADIAQLAKVVSSKSSISDNNRLKLRKVLKERLGDQTPQEWDDYRNVKDCLNHLSDPELWQNPLFPALKRIIKGKDFFQRQVGLEEELILIPRWYHATTRMGLQGIVRDGKIEVRHKQNYKGAWVSSAKENFGPYLLTFSDKIADLDPNAKIHLEWTDRRWRGLQTAIPLRKDEKVSHLAFIGVPSKVDKMAQKTDKLELVRMLKEKGFPNPHAFSVTQLDFMQEEVMTTLGNPNLSDQWWGRGLIHSEHQTHLQGNIGSTAVDPKLFEMQAEASHNQIALGQIIQSTALPRYKELMPQNPTYRSNVTGARIELCGSGGQAHKQREGKVNEHLAPARDHHGAMHCVRVTLWTQLLSRAYERLGRGKVDHPILLGTAGAFHDIAREAEGIDYWDEESSEALATLLHRAKIDPQQAEKYIQAIKEKDPKNGQFSSDEQRVVHDADCLDIIRVVGQWNFRRKELCFYHFDPNQKQFCDALIDEISEFISLTENFEVRRYLEHQSQDYYGDLIRVLFAMKKGDQPRFPLITQLLKEDMEEILKTQTEASQHLLSFLS